MIFESAVFLALLYGLISAATLPLGAIIGVLWRPQDRVLAFLLAFGGGALLAALTIDLIAPAVELGHFGHIAIGAIIGGFLFKLLNYLINRKGGYLRKPSTAMTYWRNQARERLRTVLKSVRRTQPLGKISTKTEDELLSILMVRDAPAGSCLYRANDSATNLYIIDDGEVELSDPQLGGKIFERLTRHDVFGRMSFIAGLHRATEAYTVRDTKLLIIPRDPFMDLLKDSQELRDIVAKIIGDDEILVYLRQRHDLSHEDALAWRDQALASLAESGYYDPPVQQETVSEDLIALLKNEKRSGFFSGLSDETLQLIAEHLIHKTNHQGYNYFHVGQPADRLYLLRRGTVYLFNYDERSRDPLVVQAGDSFGALSFFTEGIHSVTAVGREESEISVLRHRDFEALLDKSPELRIHLAEYLRRKQVAEYLTRQQHLDSKKAAKWMDRAAKSVEGGEIFPSLAEITRHVAGHEGAAMAVYLGILLDGIPESFVIGSDVLVTGSISISLIGGLFLSNLPEALSSAAGMKEQGMKMAKILGMWTSLMVFTGIGAGLGAVLLEGASDTVFALIEGIAAGAMLTVVAETMLPEAFHKGGGVVGISTLVGFLATVYLNTLS